LIEKFIGPLEELRSAPYFIYRPAPYKNQIIRVSSLQIHFVFIGL